MTTAVKKAEFFKILVDGKEFGPFPKSKSRRFAALRHRAGVVFIPLFLEQQKAESRKQKAESRKQKAAAFSFRWPGLASGTKTINSGGGIMKNWHIALMFFVAFAIVGTVDRPEYYDFEYKDMPSYKHEKNTIKTGAAAVENLLKTPARLVYSPSPIFWR